MNTIDISAIILALIGVASGWVTWLLDRRKHQAEVERIKAEVKGMEPDPAQKYMELAKVYVEQFRINIVEPLQHEVLNLRDQIIRLKDAIQEINNCPLSSDCPVRKRLHNESPSDVRGEK